MTVNEPTSSTLPSMDDLGKSLLTALLTSLSLESCIPYFLSHNIDVFRWLGMKQADDYVGIESLEQRQILALFTQTIHRHLNDLPLFPNTVYDDNTDDDDISDAARSSNEILCNTENGVKEAICRAVELFDHYTRSQHGADTSHNPKHERLAPTILPTFKDTPSSSQGSVGTIPYLYENSTYGNMSLTTASRTAVDIRYLPPPPSYEEGANTSTNGTTTNTTATITTTINNNNSNNGNNKLIKTGGFIRRLSIRQKKPRPISMPANLFSPGRRMTLSTENLPESCIDGTQSITRPEAVITATTTSTSSPSSSRYHLSSPQRFYESSPSVPTGLTLPRSCTVGRSDYYLANLQRQEQQHRQLQRDQYLKRRWEKCRSCVILPREEEGREELPAYNCTVYKMGYVYIKKEKDAPSLKSRRRSWKKFYVELWGTILRFYHAKESQRAAYKTLFKSSLVGNKSGVVSDNDPLSSYFLSSPASSSPSSSSTTSHNAYHFVKRQFQYQLHHATPVSTISLARADASRAWDYTKHPHTLRLTIDQGPQLLMRLPSHAEMISWIEQLQSAINISLDLELRPMPKFITLPTRQSVSPFNNTRTLHLERVREQRFMEQYELLI